ncbi:hypothetical protein J2128_002170 [Methanomicrobium sp. W14]|nr:hypothetical protein [Methanomicrobium sp. W14]MBP2134204.1 hypothetical protein [Methanomicrobium sp. W14]
MSWPYISSISLSWLSFACADMEYALATPVPAASSRRRQTAK